jgi:hypothetical protein
MAERKRPEKQAPTPPEADVTEKMDPEHSEADFLRDLGKATSNTARTKLGLPGQPGPPASQRD